MSRVKCSSHLVIHKNDWDRIKKQSKSADEVIPVNPREEYFAELNKQSQKWIRKWPNSFEVSQIIVLQLILEKARGFDKMPLWHFKLTLSGSRWSLRGKKRWKEKKRISTHKTICEETNAREFIVGSDEERKADYIRKKLLWKTTLGVRNFHYLPKTNSFDIESDGSKTYDE